MNKIKSSSEKLGRGIPSNSPLHGTVEKIKTDVSSASSELSFLERRFNYAIGSMVAYGSINLFKSIASDVVTVTGEFEQLQVAIDAFTGSAETGRKVTQQMMDIAVKSPFEIKEITGSARQLLAYGDTADNVATSIKMMSDVSAGSTQSIKDISYLYGTSMTQGRLYARDLFQFANRGIPIYDALAKTMKDFNGETGISTERVMQLTKSGKVGFDELKVAIESMTSAGGIYYGMSDKLAETTYGKISNLKDKWTLALKDMGEAQKGVINTGVEATTFLISHWEGLATAITAAGALVGSYQVAKMMVGVSNGLANASSNLAETNSLALLISAERQADFAKQGMIKGSLEYQAAVLNEVSLIEAQAAAAVSGAQAQVMSTKEVLMSKEASLVVSQASLDAAILEGDAAAIAAASQVRYVANMEKVAAAKAFNTAKTNLETAATEKNIIASQISTAAKAGEAAGTDLVALAKVKLTAITATLNKTISANPYIAAGVAIAGLVTIMWALHDSTTAAEKAQKRLQDSTKEIQDAVSARQKAFTDLLNVVKSDVSSDAQREEAYQKLKIQYKDIIGLSTLADLRKAKSADLEKANNAQINETVRKQKEDLAIKKELAIFEKAKIKYAEDMKGAMSPYMVEQAKKEFNESKKIYNDRLKDYRDYLRSLDNEKANKGKAPDVKDVVFDKEHWDGVLKIANAALDAIDSKQRAILNVSQPKTDKTKIKGVSDENVSAYVEAMQNKRKAEKELLAYEKEKAAKNVSDNSDKLKADILSNSNKIIDIRTKAELSQAQAAIDAMDEGFQKQQAVQANNFQKELENIANQKNELLKLENDSMQKEYQLKNKDWKKKGGVTADGVRLKAGDLPDANQSLSTQSASTIKTLTDAAYEKNMSANKKLLDSLLKEYDDYAAAKIAIDKKYDADFAALEAERTPKNSTQIDSSQRQLRVKQAKEQMTLSFNQFKSTPEFALAFEDLDRVSTQTLEHLMSELEKFKDTAAGTMKLADFKEWAKVQQEVFDKLVSRDPFGALKLSVEELNIAQKDALYTKSRLDAVNSGNKVIGSYTSVKGVDGISKLVPVYLTAAKAAEEFEVAQNNVAKSSDNVKKSTKVITDAIGELSKNLSSVGSSIGGASGEIISLIGDVGSFVTSSITSWNSISTGAVGALKTVEQASVILGIISVSIQLFQKIDELIPSSYDKYVKYAEKLAEINKLTDMVNEYRLAVLKAKQADEGWFGNDTLKSLKDMGEQSVLIREEYLKKMNEKQAKFTNNEGGGFLSFNTGSKKEIVSAKDNLRLETQKKSSGFLGIGAKAQKTTDLVQWVKDNLNTDLFDKDGWLNTEAFDAIMAKHADKLVGETKATLESLNELKKSHDEYMTKLKDYVNNLYSPIIENMTNSLWDWLDSGKSAMDSFKEYSSDTFRSIMSDMMKTILIKKVFDGFDDSVTALYDKYNQGTITESQLMSSVSDLTGKLGKSYEQQLPVLETLLKTMAGNLKDTTGIDVTKGGKDGSNSTSSAIKGMDQTTADILTAQFSALRIHGANIDMNIVKIGSDVSNLLLSLQGQAGELQLAFKDISRIANNTDRLFAIESALSDMNKFGVRLK